MVKVTVVMSGIYVISGVKDGRRQVQRSLTS